MQLNLAYAQNEQSRTPRINDVCRNEQIDGSPVGFQYFHETSQVSWRATTSGTRSVYACVVLLEIRVPSASIGPP